MHIEIYSARQTKCFGFCSWKNGPDIVYRWLEHDWASIAHRLPRVSSKTVMGNTWFAWFRDFLKSHFNTEYLQNGSWRPQLASNWASVVPGLPRVPSHGIPWAPGFRSLRAQKKHKNYRTTWKSMFSQKLFFYKFKLYLGGLGVSRGMAWTIRGDSLELWPGLVLQDMGEVDFHVFGKYWKLTSSPNTSKLVVGPPDWSSDFLGGQGTE